MLQNTRLQRNGRRSPRSDGNMNNSRVKIKDRDHEILSKLTANWLVLNFVDFFVSLTTTKISKCVVF